MRGETHGVIALHAQVQANQPGVIRNLKNHLLKTHVDYLPFACCWQQHGNIYVSERLWAFPIAQQNQWREAKTLMTFTQHGIPNMKGQLACWGEGGSEV